jgi:hypothetical protein
MTEKHINLTGLKLQEPELLEHFGGTSPSGATLAVNRNYFLRNGEPWFPIMGEFHFSRFPEAEWEEELLKMKSGGIEIVATYIFWIHHEEIEGEFDWSGQRNLGKFVRLCAEHGLYVWLRVGPWAHGECRNGGFPDWVENGGFETRCDSEPYLGYVKRFFHEISLQVQGMMFEDNGPVIGIQLENEYGHCGGFRGEKGLQHMLTLKRLCRETGLNAPFYTATAWGGAVVAEGETLPVYGGYIEAPWDRHVHEQNASPEYLFRRPAGETSIGTDLQTGGSQRLGFSAEQYPYLTAELGGGIQVTRHRRPYLTGDEIEAFILSKLGSGVALLGYYMYHGGTNPKGRLTTLQESTATGMWNDLPEYSYDFQAPLREYGQMKDSYGKLRRIHRFVQDFSRELALSEVFLPEDQPKDAEDMEALRYSVRYGREGGFLFLNNFQRRREMTEKKDVRISVQTDKGVTQFPSIDLKNGSRWIFPFDLSLGKAHLQWATAQLLCKLHDDSAESVVFFGEEGAAVCLSRTGIQAIEANGAEIEESSAAYLVKVPVPGREVSIKLQLEDGNSMFLVVLSMTESEQALKISREDGEYLLLSDADLYCAGQGLRIGRKGNSSSLTPSLTSGLPSGGITAEFDIPMEMYCAGQDETLTPFLRIDFHGDKARLFINGIQEADWFYIGGVWEVGLERFRRGNLSGNSLLHIRLEIDPLHKEDSVYLDNRPEFENNICCRLNSVNLVSYIEKTLSFGNIGQKQGVQIQPVMVI